ncbi:hypothetical protein TrST_g726 [Triparma strigata]|uniref:RING-type domain-containing protein n=2 Tax=Triparma strigata TaxID=1606541 RepID=A0A9W7B5A8_9STRA|nr:hypothetical protein TrST_g726 [Triparma strigata]
MDHSGESLLLPTQSLVEPNQPSRHREVSEITREDDPDRIKFLLARVRESLSINVEGRGEGADVLRHRYAALHAETSAEEEPRSANVAAHEQHKQKQHVAQRHAHPSMSMMEMFPSRSTVNAAEEKRRQWAREWEERRGTASPSGHNNNNNSNSNSNHENNSKNNYSSRNRRRQQEHMEGWEGGLGDVLSPPPRQTNIDRDVIPTRASPVVQAVPGYARPLTEADVRGRQDQISGGGGNSNSNSDFASQPLEAVLRRPAPPQQAPAEREPVQQVRRRNPQPSNEEWGGGLGDVLVDVAAGSPVHVVRQQQQRFSSPPPTTTTTTTTTTWMTMTATSTPGRTRAQVSAERAAESESTWGNFEDTFVRRRPPSGNSERRRQARIQQQHQQRIINRERQQNQQNRQEQQPSPTAVLRPYVSVYPGTSSSPSFTSDYLSDSALSSLPYTQLQSLPPHLPPPAKCPTSPPPLQTVKYDPEKHTSSSECAICLEPFSEGEALKVIECGHLWHKRCIGEWMKVDRRCPCCRFEVV